MCVVCRSRSCEKFWVDGDKDCDLCFSLVIGDSFTISSRCRRDIWAPLTRQRRRSQQSINATCAMTSPECYCRSPASPQRRQPWLGAKKEFYLQKKSNLLFVFNKSQTCYLLTMDIKNMLYCVFSDIHNCLIFNKIMYQYKKNYVEQRVFEIDMIAEK